MGGLGAEFHLWKARCSSLERLLVTGTPWNAGVQPSTDSQREWAALATVLILHSGIPLRHSSQNQGFGLDQNLMIRKFTDQKARLLWLLNESETAILAPEDEDRASIIREIGSASKVQSVRCVAITREGRVKETFRLALPAGSHEIEVERPKPDGFRKHKAELQRERRREIKERAKAKSVKPPVLKLLVSRGTHCEQLSKCDSCGKEQWETTRLVSRTDG